MGFLLFVPLILVALSSVIHSADHIINIGSSFNQQSINGKVSIIAMKAALDDINSDPTILPRTQLSLSYHDIDFTGFFSILAGKTLTLFNFALCHHPYLHVY